MLQKSIWSKPKWWGTSSRLEGTAPLVPVATALAYLSTFENAKSGDLLPANSIAGKFRLSDLTPVSTALIINCCCLLMLVHITKILTLPFQVLAVLAT